MQDDTNKNRTVAYKLLACEAILTGVAALLLLITVNIETAASVIIGGLAFVVPNAYFTKYVFRYSASDSARLAVRGLYVGEVIKIIATVVIFTLAFLVVEQLNVSALFLTYIVMLILNLWGNSILMGR